MTVCTIGSESVGEETVNRAVRGDPAAKQPVQGKEEEMKYVVSYTLRLNGSATENEAAAKRLLELYSGWTPHASMTFHQFVGRVDGNGGFSVVETDNPMDLLDAASKFGPVIDYQIHPVVDIVDSVRVAQEGVKFRESIS
jgi:hypothetical protein